MINGERISNLRFVDDVVLLANSMNQLTEMIIELDNQSKTTGLSINTYKTKILTKHGNQEKIKINGNDIEIVKEVLTYLGQIFSFEDKMGKEVRARISKAWTKYWSLKRIFKGSRKSFLKSNIFYHMYMIPTLTYGCQTWSLNSKNIKPA